MKWLLSLAPRILGIAVIAVTISSGNAFADDIKKANDLVKSFYSAYIKGNIPKVASMFSPDASGRLVTKLGGGLPDNVVTFKGQNVKGMVKWEVPKKYRKYMNSYKESGHQSSIINSTKKGVAVQVKGRMTSKYSMTNYKGTNVVETTFLIELRNGTPKIVKYDSLATYK